MRYKYKQEDLFEFVKTMGFETKEKGNELLFKRCPYCDSGGHKDDFWKFSVNMEKGVFHCFRASCGEKGHFVKLAHDFGYQLWEEGKPFRKYEGIQSTPMGWMTAPNAVRYLQSRGIPEEITRQCKITTAIDNESILIFPFFDENGIRQTTKYRNTNFRKGIDKGKEWFDKETKPILYGMWLWKDFTKPLVITEGQIDMLSLMSAGIENAVSVPNGAKAFSWVKHCREWVEQFPEIIVFGDFENGKMTLVEEIDKEFPTMPLKAVKRSNYMGCKDANEIVTTQAIGNDFTSGYKILQASVMYAENARNLPIVGVNDIDWMDFKPPKRIKTGFPTIDKKTRGFIRGSFNVLCGATGIGKSSFTMQLAINAVHSGKKVLIYSGEIHNKKILQTLTITILGSNRVTQIYDPEEEEYYTAPKTGFVEIAKKWIENRILFWEDEALHEDETDEEKKNDFLKNLQRVVNSTKTDMVILDNLMTLTAYNSDKDLYNQQSDFCQKMTDIAKKMNIVILLVTHPRKYSGVGGSTRHDEISGSSNIVNLASLVLFYGLVEDKKDPDLDVSNRQIVVSKNRENGVLLEDKNAVRTMYSPRCRRIIEAIRDSNGKIIHDKQAMLDAQIDYLAEYPPTAQMLSELEIPW